MKTGAKMALITTGVFLVIMISAWIVSLCLKRGDAPKVAPVTENTTTP